MNESIDNFVRFVKETLETGSFTVNFTKFVAFVVKQDEFEEMSIESVCKYIADKAGCDYELKSSQFYLAFIKR